MKISVYKFIIFAVVVFLLQSITLVVDASAQSCSKLSSNMVGCSFPLPQLPQGTVCKPSYTRFLNQDLMFADLRPTTLGASYTGGIEERRSYNQAFSYFGNKSACAGPRPVNFYRTYALYTGQIPTAPPAFAIGWWEVGGTACCMGDGCQYGDVNRDGIVNSSDIVILYSNYGKKVSSCSQGDINSDGNVDAADFGILAQYYINQ